MLNEFKAFIMKGNVMDLAFGIIMAVRSRRLWVLW